MPTYICRGTGLDDPARSRLAAAITDIHREVTGADGFFAQVLFEDLDPSRCFLGGAPLAAPHLFVHGHIRAGRSATDRTRLIARITAAATELLMIPLDAVWVYVSELAPRAMAEYGAVLPEPGEEGPWLAGLPEPTRLRLTRR